MELMHKALNFFERFRYIEDRSQIVLIVLAMLTAFGLLNCILGYRLLRFWMMLGGIAAGAVLGYFLIEAFGLGSQNHYIFGCAGCGIVCGVLVFFFYKLGIFLMGALMGLVISFYFLHPLSYTGLFVCFLIGAAVGALALKFLREVVIAATSLLGGTLAGLAGARLADLDDLPYGIAMSVAAVVLGVLIQFTINKKGKANKRNLK